eukprot:12410670-Karenia_brevis.AAC.1
MGMFGYKTGVVIVRLSSQPAALMPRLFSETHAAFAVLSQHFSRADAKIRRVRNTAYGAAGKALASASVDATWPANKHNQNHDEFAW